MAERRGREGWLGAPRVCPLRVDQRKATLKIEEETASMITDAHGRH